MHWGLWQLRQLGGLPWRRLGRLFSASKALRFGLRVVRVEDDEMPGLRWSGSGACAVSGMGEGDKRGKVCGEGHLAFQPWSAAGRMRHVLGHSVLTAAPDDVPIRHVPSRVVHGEQIQPCTEDFLPSVPGKFPESFFSLIFPIYQGRRDPALAFNPPGVHRGPQQCCRRRGCCISTSQQRFRDGSKCLSTIPCHNQRRVERSRRQHLRPGL